MLTLKEIDRQISETEAEIRSAKSAGDPLYDRQIDSTRNRATSEATATTYYRLRWVQDGRRMSQRLTASEKAEYEKRIELGRKIQKLDRALEKLHRTRAALVERISRIAG